jgi:hypothetical protein
MKSLLAAPAALLGLFAMSPAIAQQVGHEGHPPVSSPAPAADAPKSAPPPAGHEDHRDHKTDSADAPAPSTGDVPRPGRIDHSEHERARRAGRSGAGRSAGAEGLGSNPAEAATGAVAAPTGALGPYDSFREASGTAWQPDWSTHGGLQAEAGRWSLMGHATLNLAYDWQQGPRGDEKAFVSGMVMGSARRDFDGGDVLQFRVMLSPDPLMGKNGFPLLLASGETADGLVPLVDRQHPHDLFMELSASYSVRLSARSSLYLYAGLPGAPAFGPPAFMHRMSAMDSPEAPISHHWLDSTHISFGVITAGFVSGPVKIEASRFNGREPDQHRYDIETGPLDSTAVRISWNPSKSLSLQGSWARLVSPEQLEPGEIQRRWSASAILTRPIGMTGWWSTTLAWGRRSGDHRNFDAWNLESALNTKDWTLFGRAEHVENDELLAAGGHHGPAFGVGKISFGVLRDFRIAPQVKLGVGALYAFNFLPAQLESAYEGDPRGAMAFVRLKIE